MVIPIAHPRGDTFERAYKVTRFDMDVSSLVGLTIWITVKKTIDNVLTDESAVFQHILQVGTDGEVILSDGITVGGIDPDPDSPTYDTMVTGVESGVFTHFLTAEESTMLEPIDYVYDVQIKTSHEPPRVKTVIENAAWSVRGDVTRRHTAPDPIDEGMG